MRITIHRSDGKVGRYHQDSGVKSVHLVDRFDPSRLFCSGPIVIGVLNPFSILNPDEVCWIEVETDIPTPKAMPKHIEQVILLEGRGQYEALLAQQWPLWMRFRKSKPGDLVEGLVELSLRGGEALYLRLFGVVGETTLIDAIFGLPAITATAAPHRTIYINPKTVVRARVYHSKEKVNYPNGIWVAEADDI